jgi:lysophospholipid acyltransferase (LPLAT)-like uncharacterized protein
MSSARQNARPINSKRNGAVTPHAPRTHQQLGAWLIWAAVRTVSSTVRFTWTDRSGWFNPAIMCVWHNRLALSMSVYHDYVRKRHRSEGLAAMVSASKDGAFLSSILEKFSVQPVRGSSSKRGSQALLELATSAERGYHLAITPDGPRGPCYVVQEGVLSLAQVTGLPIIPVSINTHWKLQLNSWDRFQIPLPFSRCEVIFEQPIFVPREASESEREELRQQLERALKNITHD